MVENSDDSDSIVKKKKKQKKETIIPGEKSYLAGIILARNY